LSIPWRILTIPIAPTKKIGWFDWMNMDIEEHAERKKREKEQTVLDSLPKKMRVPKKYAPSFTPSLILGILVVLHALIMLLQHWSVAFKVWLNYRELDAAEVELSEDMMELNLDLEDTQHGSNIKSHNDNTTALDARAISGRSISCPDSCTHYSEQGKACPSSHHVLSDSWNDAGISSTSLCL
jgi:hypothetical protein